MLVLALSLHLVAGGPAPASAPSSSSGTFDRLHSSYAEASSYLKSNWNKYEENYHPTYLLDDNPKTAWVEGVEGDGAKEWLALPLSKVNSARAVKLVIVNGYQKSKALLEANAAPKKVTVIVLGPDDKESGRAEWNLDRKMGKQELVVPVKAGVGTVKLVVDEVHPGKTYKDLCISDLQVFVDSDVPYNAKAEQAKKKEALAWMKERIETAKYFAKLPKEFAWAATRFTEREDAVKKSGSVWTVKPSEKNNWQGKLKKEFDDGVGALLAANHELLQSVPAEDRAELQRLVAFKNGEKPAGASTMRMERTANSPVRLPDSVWLGFAAPYVSLGDVVLSEAVAGSKGRTRSESEEGYVYFKETVSDPVVVKRPDGSVERMLVSVTTISNDRVSSTSTSHWVLAYDEQGRLATSSSIDYTDGDMGAGPAIESFTVQRFTRDGTGKISEVKSVRGGSNYFDDGGDGDFRYEVRTVTQSATPTS